MEIKLPARTARLLLWVNVQCSSFLRGATKFCCFLYQSCGSLKTAAIRNVRFHPAVSSESSVTQVQEMLSVQARCLHCLSGGFDR